MLTKKYTTTKRERNTDGNKVHINIYPSTRRQQDEESDGCFERLSLRQILGSGKTHQQNND
jgi:hypothetical protein